MKTLKITMIGLALFLICGVAKAAPCFMYSSTKDDAIKTYLEAVVHGKLSDVESVIDDDAQFNIARGSKVNTLTKNQELNYLKSTENMEQNCNCSNSVVQDSEDTYVKKVDMKYADFTRTDIITVQHVGAGWKITKVQTSFK
jgi:hypothetical protein